MKHIFYSIVIIISLLFNINIANAANGKVVVIDGINFGDSIDISHAPDSGYLYSYIANNPYCTYWYNKITQNIGTIVPFPWSTNISDTDKYVQQLSSMLEDISTSNKLINAPTVVIAHSWGTVLAYIAISQNSNIHVDKFITLGSPLSSETTDILAATYAVLASHQIYMLTKPSNVGTWHNYWNLLDLISGPIPALTTLFSGTNPTGDSNILIFSYDLKGHFAYFEDNSVWQKILYDFFNTSSTQLPNPVITQPLLSGPPGTTFSQSGNNFTPNGTAVLHFLKPDSSEYPTASVQVDINGNFQTSYTSPLNKEPGVYIWWAIDSITGLASNQISYEITTPTFGPTVNQTPIGGPPGTTFTQWGYGFTPNDNVTLHFQMQDGTEYPTQNVQTSSAGYFSISYTAPSDKAAGNYTWWGIDAHTGSSSNKVSYQILANSPQTVFIQSHTVIDNETWYSGWTYIVQGYIDVAQHATLTIQPGTIIKLNSGVQLSVNGTLNAVGTTTSQIKFTWADGQNQWSGILFQGSGASNSRLDNCIVENASGTIINGYPYYGMLRMVQSSPTITGCTFNIPTGRYGIYLDSSSAVISNSTFSGTGNNTGINVTNNSAPTVTGSTFSGNGNGISIAADSGGTYTGNTLTGNGTGVSVAYSANNPVLSGNTFSNNTTADISAYGTITGTATWDGTSSNGTYYLQSLSIAQGATLNIASGNTVKLTSGAQITVNGTLKATGVHFTSDGQNQWSGILFQGSGASNSRLDNCIVENASGTIINGYPYYGMLRMVQSSPTITGCTFNIPTGRYGIYLDCSSAVISNSTFSGTGNNTGINVTNNSAPTVTGSTFSGNGNGISIAADSGGMYTGNTFSGNGTGVSVAYSANNPVLSGNTFSNNTTADISAYGTITGTATWDGTSSNGTYYLQSLSIAQGATLNIASGNTVKLTSGAQITVNGTLKATGVHFTSDGQNQWSGILFQGSGASNSRLDNCIVENARV